MSSFLQNYLDQKATTRESFQFPFQFSLQFLILEMVCVFCYG